MRRPRWFDAALLLLTAVALLGLFSTEMADPDSWWHLRTGKFIVTEHRLPHPDPFAWTTSAAAPGYAGEERTRAFNLKHEWLAQALMYGIWAVGGFGAVVLWKAVLLTATCGISGWIAARRTGSLLWGLFAAVGTSSLAIVFRADRPALISFLFVPLFMAVFESGRRLWLLPVLAIVWANCHGGFFLGWVVCLAYSAETLLRRGDIRRVCGWSAVAIVASGLNPSGFAVVPTLILYRQSFLTSTLIEWSKPYLWGPPYAFNLLLYSAAAVLAFSWRRVRVADWVLFVLFTIAALMAFRNMILIGILAPVLIATYFPWRRSLGPAIGYAALACAVGALVWGVAQGRFFQLRAAEWRYPAGAATFLRTHGIDARLFNTYEYGGYLIWRGERVFIDGRALSETVFEDYRKILGSDQRDPVREATLKKYGIGAMVVNSFEFHSGVIYPLVLSLLNAGLPEWRLVYNDPQALVLVRDVSPGMSVLPRERILEHLEAACALHIERDPEFSLCARELGFRFMAAGQRERARRAFALYLEHPYMDDPEARRAYASLLSGN